MNQLKTIACVFCLLHIAFTAKAQNECAQMNATYCNNMERSVRDGVLMLVRTNGISNTIIDEQTGFFLPGKKNHRFCADMVGFAILTDDHIVDVNEDGRIDTDWKNGLFMALKFQAPPNSACNFDLPDFELNSSATLAIDDFNPKVELFSPKDKYGFAVITFEIKKDQIPPALSITSFGISLEDILDNDESDFFINYHPFKRRVVKEAYITELRIPINSPPGSPSTNANHWIFVPQLDLNHYNPMGNDPGPFCWESHVDDFTSVTAPLFFIDEATLGSIARSHSEYDYQVCYAAGFYSKSSELNSICTNTNLWFVNFRSIWSLPFESENGTSSFRNLYGDNSRINPTYYYRARIDFSTGYIGSLKYDFNGGVETGILNAGRFVFGEQSRLTFKAPQFTFNTEFFSGPTELRSESGGVVKVLAKTIGGSNPNFSSSLKLVSTGRGSLTELNTCKVNDEIKSSIQQIRAANEGRVLINAGEGDLILGYPDPFIDQRSIVVEEDGRVDIIMGKGNLYINGGIVIEPGGELNIWVSESKKLVFTNELETIRNLKLLGALNLQAGTLEMRGNNRISGTGGRFNPRILRIEGEVGMPKAASLIVNTQETIIQNGKLVAIAEGPAGAPNGRVFIYSVTKTSVEDFSRLGPIARIKNLLRYIPTPKPDVQSMCCDEDINKEIKQQSPTDNLTPFTAKENRVVQKDTKNQTQLYPNPFSDELNISFTLESAANYLLLQVYNQQGVQVHSRQINGTSKGNQTLTWKAGSVSAGVYFIKVTDSMGKVLLQQKAVKQ